MADFYTDGSLNELHLKVIAFEIQNNDGRGREESVCGCVARGGEDPSFISGYSTAARAVAVKLGAVAQVWLHRHSYRERCAGLQAVKAARSGSAARPACLQQDGAQALLLGTEVETLQYGAGVS